jgi:hypothetical protein
MNSTAKVRPLVETDDRDLDPPTPTPPVPRRQPEFFA